MSTAVAANARAHGAVPTSGARLAFAFGGASLALDVADEAALAMVQEAYSPLESPGGPGRIEASIRRLADGRLHVRYGRQLLGAANAADPIPLRAAFHAAREVFARFACEPAHAVALYGALCAVDGGAILVLGPTAIGKTLLALHMAHAGATFLGDETVLVSLSAHEAYALPRRPALRESALPLLPDERIARAVAQAQSSFESDRGRFWYALDAQALGGIEPSMRSYPLRAVCIVGGRGQTATIRNLDHGDAVKFMANRAYARPTSLAQLGALRRALRHAACFEMVLGAPRESCELLLRQVRTCA
jgi:hypothetical protein